MALLAVAETALHSGARGFGVIQLGGEATSRSFDRVVEMRQRKHPEHAAVTVWIVDRSVESSLPTGPKCLAHP